MDWTGGAAGGFGGGGGFGMDMGGAAGGGGGFLPTGSQESPNKRAGTTKTITPVTVKQMLSCSKEFDDSFKLDGHELMQVTFVGLVKSRTEQNLNITLKVDDGTGSLDVKVWLDEDEANFMTSTKHEWMEGTYVRIFGHLKPFKEARNVVAFRIHKLVDFNELTCHFLDVIHTHLFQTKGGPPGGAAGSVAGAIPGAAGASGLAGGSSFSSDQLAVLEVIRNLSHSDTGASVEDIASSLRHVSKLAIQESIEFLQSEGHIYSTTDDSHFKPT